ncbi:hypothetical protein [Enterobacter sp.]|uniref:hypothetical protein n=1 Tax=Enterobacter sp. TaxID=42895 RepID=UPI00296E4938|nr:hypothetical protein [Enterobacter sp.]
MSTKVARNHHHLKSRIDDYFSARFEHLQAKALIDALASHHQVWIFGGMIRDISLYGYEGFTSDIDVVFEGDREELCRILSSHSVEAQTTNKLGGVRFRYHHIDFDMWCLSDTWAFKENIIPLVDAKSLCQTTLMSWDAALYDVHRQEVIARDSYLDDLMAGYLEVVLRETPNETGSVVRILRTIYSKNVKKLGPVLCEFLKQTLTRYDYHYLAEYEIAHYSSKSFTSAQYTSLVDALFHATREEGLPLRHRG